MKNFIRFLDENFLQSIDEIAKSSNDNTMFDDDFLMYNLDLMNEKLSKLDKKFKGNDFATSDAFFISNIDNELIFHFIEFKNVDFDDEKDLKMSGYWLNKCLSEMKEGEHNCFINDDSNPIKKSHFDRYLIDKYFLSLRAKPFESLAVVYNYLKILESLDDNSCNELLFDTKKIFYLVSRTDKFLNNPYKNKSNVHMAKIIGPFKSFARLYPYHYNNDIAINDDVFKRYIRDFQ